MENDLIKTLRIFKLARTDLVRDILQENADIYNAMFKYENDNSLMQLSIDKYIIGFINNHLFLAKKAGTINYELNIRLMELIKSMNNKLSTSLPTKIFQEMLDVKLIFIEELLSLAGEDNDRYDKLLYSYQKDKTLFDREIEKHQRK